MTSRERVYRCQAVVLRRRDFGEADRLLTVHTPDRGKLRLVAKGVRRPKSRKAGHLEPLTRVQLLVARGRELDIITQAEAVELYPSFRQDLESFSHAAYVAELTDCFAAEGEENRALYYLLVGTLDRLASGDAPAVVLRHFELRLLDLVGFRPELFRCVGCQAEVRPQDQFFSASQGGILCPQCGQREKRARGISLPVLKVMRHYQRHPYAVAAAALVRQQVLSDLEAIMEHYLGYLLERRLNTPAFLRRVRKLRRGQAVAETTT
ncbi:MAG: DNA repair protein RecO [Anaerolineales bacterium]|jgi:DNA repair protein RecO (recombination protein O)